MPGGWGACLALTKETLSLLLNTILTLTLVVQSMCDALTYLSDNIYFRFGTNLFRQTVGILMGTNSAPLKADVFYFAMREISWLFSWQ